MALVVAILTAFILLALLASLFWIVAATSRQENYATNAAIALNLAEAGVADAIYRFNYTGKDALGYDTFPFWDSLNALGGSITTDAANLNLSGDLTYLVRGDNTGLKGTLNDGSYYVGLLDDAVGDTITIIAVGEYKGVRRQLKVPLRGRAYTDRPRQYPGQGISEAFNKHAVYARNITCAGTTVSGNLAANNLAGTLPGAATFTRIESGYFEVPIYSAPFPSPSLVPVIPDKRFRDEDGAVSNYQNTTGAPYVLTTEWKSTYDAWIDYPNSIPSDDQYTVEGANNERWQFEPRTGTDTLVHINYTAAVYPINAVNGHIYYERGDISVPGQTAVSTSSGGNIYLYNTTSTRPNCIGNICAAGSITIRSGTIQGNIEAGGDILVTGGTITGNLTANGNIILAGGIINGSVYAGGDLAVTNSVGPVTVNAASSNRRAALACRGTLLLAAAPVISLGGSQDTAFLVESGGSDTAIINAVAQIYYANTVPAQAALIAMGNPAIVNLNAGAGFNDSYSPGRSRLIYAGGADSEIRMNGGTFYGILVASGTVTLSGGTLYYLETPGYSFFILPAGADYREDLFKGFSGGRRAYAPVWKSWSFK